jgi:hypothetical protein
MLHNEIFSAFLEILWVCYRCAGLISLESTHDVLRRNFLRYKFKSSKMLEVAQFLHNADPVYGVLLKQDD